MRCKVKKLLTAVLLVTAIAFAELKVPKLNRRVTDMAGLLTPSQINFLERKLARFERETSNQIAILILPSLEGENIEDFSIRVVEKNKIGQKGRDNGVLFLIALKERKMRIEVGYGLEGALPDALADQILRRIVAPEFRRGNYFEGINAGVDAIISATKGEFKGFAKKKSKGLGFGWWIFLFFVAFVFLNIIFSGLRGARHYQVGSGGYASSLFWMWVLGSMLGGGRGPSSWGGGGGSWGDDFGSWSGGGGSFGGGGATGSW